MRRLILLSLLLLLIFLSTRVNAQEIPPNEPYEEPTAQECPEGTYNIGISKDGSPLCKLEPTGCPYGDSIPLDQCDKFKPEQPKDEQPIIGK